MKNVMGAIEAFLLATLARVNIAVLREYLPLLQRQSKELVGVAAPLAKAIVADVAKDGKFDGWDKHKEAVNRLRAELNQSYAELSQKTHDLDLGQIVLSAFRSWATESGKLPANGSEADSKGAGVPPKGGTGFTQPYYPG